jgi:hypothetical protein
MPEVKYVGPHVDGVVIPYGLGEIAAPHGVPVEVPDDLAAGLLDQPSNWQPAKAARKVKEDDDES